MELSKYRNCKKVKITLKDKKIFIGSVDDIYNGDEEYNEPKTITVRSEGENLTGSLVEIEEPEIETIEILDYGEYR